LRSAVEKRLVGRRFLKNETQNRKSRNIRRNHNQFFPPRPEQKTARPPSAPARFYALPSDFAPSALIFYASRRFRKKISLDRKKFFAIRGVKKRRIAANFEKNFARLFRVAGRIERIDYNREDDARRRTSTPSAFPRRALDVNPRFPLSRRDLASTSNVERRARIERRRNRR